VKSKFATLLILTIGVCILCALLLGATQRLSSSAGYISGQVLSVSSKPAASLWVILSIGSTQKGQSLTGDDGRYYIGGLQNGTYTIMVRKNTTGSNLFKGQITLPKNKIYNVKIR
jgi:hypothetical protein